MSLQEAYQTSLSLNTLYELSSLPTELKEIQCSPNIWFKGGTISIYTSQSTNKPSALTSMTLAVGDTGLVEDIYPIRPNARYICVKQESGTTSELVLTGIKATNLGNIV